MYNPKIAGFVYFTYALLIVIFATLFFGKLNSFLLLGTACALIAIPGMFTLYKIFKNLSLKD